MTLNRNIEPEIQNPIDFDYHLPPINTQILNNGIPLYWLNAGVQDVVEINWVFPAGVWHETKSATASATASQLKNGTINHAAAEINEALEYFGASLKVNAGNDYTTVSLHSLTKHLPNLLPIIFDLMVQPVFPVHELEIYKQNAIQRLLISLRECEFVANQQIDLALFGAAHPYGRFTQKEPLEALQSQDLLDFHRTRYQFSEMKIFMAGRFSDLDVQLMNDIFGTAMLTKNKDQKQQIFTSAFTPQKLRIENDPNGVQAAIRIGRKFVTRNHPDFAALVVLNTLFGGYFGSRLMSNIREEKGFTYGIYSSIGAFANDASLTIHTEVGSHVCEQAITEIYKEMELLCAKPIEEEELLLVKNYLLGNILGDLDGPFSIMQRWRSMILNGFTAERFEENIGIYKNVTPKKLLSLSQQYFNPNDFTQIVVQ